MTPYYSDEHVTLWLGKFEDVLPTLGRTFDLIVTDPPYGETSLQWDRWPDGWPTVAAEYAKSMWCFGSMRMFLDRGHEFDGWKFSQDVVWETHDGSGFATDRFRRVHEHALHWYRGDWASIHHETPRAASGARNRGRAVLARGNPAHTGQIDSAGWEDDGTRLHRSVTYARSMHGRAINETEKPVTILEPLISYACPPGGTVLDIFAGSASTAVAARALGRKSVLIEAREAQCEAAAKRLSQGLLDFGASA